MTKEEAKAEAQNKANNTGKGTAIYKRHSEGFWRVWWAPKQQWMVQDKDIAEIEEVKPEYHL